MTNLTSTVPRRNQIDKVTAEEREIYDITQRVEALGAHPLLTSVVMHLHDARNLLADWVETKEVNR